MRLITSECLSKPQAAAARDHTASKAADANRQRAAWAAWAAPGGLLPDVELGEAHPEGLDLADEVQDLVVGDVAVAGLVEAVVHELQGLEEVLGAADAFGALEGLPDVLGRVGDAALQDLPAEGAKRFNIGEKRLTTGDWGTR